ncbi:hypothetical protein HYX05_01740 [Candidatus Woesearchaeota archaeon]|nr:hypothetical protein [Candidatus Woesearchaeota archaeon]
MLKKQYLFLLLIFSIVINCSPKNDVNLEESNRDAGSEISVESPVTEKQGLGNLCSGEAECKDFCSKNRGQCEAYCRGKQIEICRIIFPPGENSHGNYMPVTSCIGKGIVTFTSPPMLIGDIELIEPIGLMIGGHVTPIDHGYYYAKGWLSPGNREDATKFRDIMAPASGIVTSVQSMPQEYSSSSIGDYRLVIHHTCSFYTIYIHVNQLSEKLRAIADTQNTAAVEAGEVIGKAPGFDFSVHNDEITLSGFIVPETYAAEPWKLHNVDMFDYFAEPTRTQLLDKNIRQKEPRGGKIDYDIDGKLVGNWFEENTNGYFGKTEYQSMSGYWSTHLAFAYDGLDPSLVIVSMGDYDGEAQQFAVRGNAPDPAEVGIQNGLVKYELVSFGYKTEEGDEWNRQNFARISRAYGYDEQVAGVALAQMLEGRKIKFEAFPGKKAAEVSGFTDKARIYER